MANKHANLDSLFNDIADAIREKIGDESIIPAVDFPDLIRDRLQVAPTPYLTFKSPNSFTLAVGDATKHWNGTLEYSTDTSTWTTWNGTSTLSAVDNGAKYVLYLRGTGNNVICGKNESSYRWVLTGNDIKCIGNIENLLDYATVTAGNHPTMAERCYNNMFRDCTSLTQAPELPATALADYCYSQMFLNCTSLTQAPALPATTLTTYCYTHMFHGCTSLTKVPALPWTTLAEHCCSHMFRGCTALTQVPALPATTLPLFCYAYMFQDCTSLKLSSTQTGEYTVEYRIPSSGTGTTGTNSNALIGMFASTGGTFKGTPKINTTYYLSNTNEVIGGPIVVGPIVVDITASNISDYFTVTNGSSYYFKGEGNVFTTNNAGVNSSTATTTLTAKQDISEISFNYSYSSEPNYDKFTLKVAGSTIENAVSGATKTKSYNGSLTSGQTIEFKYVKDSSVNKNDDKCTFSNMVIKLG